MLYMETPKLTLRIDLGAGRALDPGKIRLLEAIDKTGSISEASRWHVVSARVAAEKQLRGALVKPQRGGASGGEAALAPFGKKLVKLYRGIEAEALSA
jgi:molybdate transport system regulatory protein